MEEDSMDQTDCFKSPSEQIQIKNEERVKY